MKAVPFSFETSFQRLEEILEQMNSGEVELDTSLKLYEEANRLIGACQSHLQKAEQRVEKLIKGRDGELELDESGEPRVEPLKDE